MPKCGGGTKARKRICESKPWCPPGNTSQLLECNTKPCPGILMHVLQLYIAKDEIKLRPKEDSSLENCEICLPSNISRFGVSMSSFVYLNPSPVISIYSPIHSSILI